MSYEPRCTIAVIGSEGRFGKLLINQIEKIKYCSTEHPYCKLLKITEHDFYSDDGPMTDIHNADAVVFCVPMRSFTAVLERYKPYISPKTLILDVCSLKVFAVEAMQRVFPNNPIIATHPLFGPQSAKNGIKGQRIMIHNVSASETVFLRVTAELNSLGLSTMICTPEFHDEQMAKSQALTHFIGRVAQHMGIDRIPLSTQSFDDLMDIIELVKGGSQELFEDMQQLNPYAAKMRLDFIDGAVTLAKQLYKL